MSIQTPNMNLIQPTIGADSGLVWEQSSNANTAILDGHTHAPGSGVQINPSGLNINTDLSFGSNNATALRSARFTAQLSPLSTPSDLGCVYVSGVDLFYNDENGNQVQITSGGAVNATSSGISSGSATASFVSSVLVVNAASNTPANIQAASILIGNNSSGSKYLTLSPPSAMAANITETLPSIPAATSFMQMDSSGNMSATVAVSAGITSTNIAAGGVSRPNLVAVGQQISSSCGTYSTTSASFVAVTNLSVTITTSGRPVMIFLQDDATGNVASFFAESSSGNNQVAVFAAIKRGSTQLTNSKMFVQPASGVVVETDWPVSSVMYLDAVGAGTYTYTLSVKANTSTNITGVGIQNAVLVAYEL